VNLKNRRISHANVRDDFNFGELMGIGGKTDPARCLEITKSVMLAFFDEQLKGETRDSLASLVQKYPELKKVDLK